VSVCTRSYEQLNCSLDYFPQVLNYQEYQIIGRRIKIILLYSLRWCTKWSDEQQYHQ